VPPEPTLRGLLGLGLIIATCLTVGLVGGGFLDHWLGTAPVFVLLGGASGIVLGVFGTIIEVRRHLDG
jgi:membrane associated rhomboid family serine protease